MMLLKWDFQWFSNFKKYKIVIAKCVATISLLKNAPTKLHNLIELMRMRVSLLQNSSNNRIARKSFMKSWQDFCCSISSWKTSHGHCAGLLKTVGWLRNNITFYLFQWLSNTLIQWFSNALIRWFLNKLIWWLVNKLIQ